MTFPKCWDTARFTEITPANAPIIYGILQPGPEVSDGVLYVRPSEIESGKLNRSAIRRTSREISNQYARSTLLEGDLILSIVGTIGKVAKVPQWLEGGNITQSSCRIRPDPKILYNDFLRFYLLSPNAKKQFARKKLGTAVPRLNIADIRNFELPLPPLAEQHRIVARLDTLLAYIVRGRAELKRLRALADQLRGAALSWARRTVANAPKLSIAEIASTSFDGPFGSNLKSSDYTDKGVRVVRLENIGHLQFVGEKQTYVSNEKYSLLERHTLQKGDILFSSFVDERIRVCIFPGNLAFPAINKADCFVVRVDKGKVSGPFVSYMLAAQATFEDIQRDIHGHTRPRIGLSQLRKYELHVPSLSKQQFISSQIEKSFARANRLEAEAVRVTKLLDRLESSILAKAFHGELVFQDPMDEPASVLLSRIRVRRTMEPKLKRGRAPADSVPAQ